LTEVSLDLWDLRVLSEEILARLASRSPLREAAQAISDSSQSVRAHLAVMNEPYLGYLLDGTKTVESRFSKRATAPFDEARCGDLLLLKVQSGPVIAIAEVMHADSFRLDPAAWDMVRTRFARAIRADDPTFWSERSEARYATLIRVGLPERIAPLLVDKRDRRPWVVLGPKNVGSARDQLELVSDLRVDSGDVSLSTEPLNQASVCQGRQLALMP
jgi:hypothetical protein